jgi:hypothetical protein
MSHGYGRSVAVFSFGQNTQTRLCTTSYNPTPVGWPACLPLPYRPLCCSGLQSACQESGEFFDPTMAYVRVGMAYD